LHQLQTTPKSADEVRAILTWLNPDLNEKIAHVFKSKMANYDHGECGIEIGNGLNGVVNGATLTTDRFGNSNNAYSFDGVNDFISTSYGGILGTNSRSISFWYNSSTNNVEETVFTDYGENNCGVGFACTLFPLNKPAVDNTCSWIKTVNSTTINNWNFYTVTHSSLDGSDLTNCKIYINGVLQSTSQSSTIYDISPFVIVDC
jgi:hypothetical protein